MFQLRLNGFSDCQHFSTLYLIVIPGNHKKKTSSGSVNISKAVFRCSYCEMGFSYAVSKLHHLPADTRKIYGDEWQGKVLDGIMWS